MTGLFDKSKTLLCLKSKEFAMGVSVVLPQQLANRLKALAIGAKPMEMTTGKRLAKGLPKGLPKDLPKDLHRKPNTHRHWQ